MKKLGLGFIFIIFAAGAVVLFNALFTVHQTQQALQDLVITLAGSTNGFGQTQAVTTSGVTHSTGLLEVFQIVVATYYSMTPQQTLCT